MSASTASSTSIPHPIPISLIASRYLIFDPPTILYLRRTHNICGVLIGTIPNLSQQNVFLGVPLELMPEEARVLVEQGAAYIVDDVTAHREGMGAMSRQERLRWMEEIDKKGLEVAKEAKRVAEKRKEEALRERGLLGKVGVTVRAESVVQELEKVEQAVEADGRSDLGFIMKGSAFEDRPTRDPKPESKPSNSTTPSLFETAASSALPSLPLQKHFITPTSSYPPLSLPTPPASPSATHLPPVPPSYPLFRYLHSRGFFHLPGIRFGCHYNAYPGDPLRFHSHFAATGLGWDEEFALLDVVVGGGRLGTGTKKGFLIGGQVEDEEPEKGELDGEDVEKDSGKGAGLFSTSDDDDQKSREKEVRAFTIEWAAL